jgi:hypothetical protein
MSCVCDADPIELSDAKMVRARKPHRCCECHEIIQPGEVYERHDFKFEGEFCTTATCECCVEDWKRLVDLGHCRLSETLEETMREAYGG